MFSWLTAIGHFFQSLFGKSANVVQTILHDAANFVNLADPIVAELAVLAKAADSNSTLIKSIEKWIAVYQADAEKVTAWISSVQGLPTADILHSAAVLALSALVPAGTAGNLLNLAIELAYAVFKRSTGSASAPRLA